MSEIILSVDDDAAVRAVRNRILREAGFEIIEAAAASEAHRLACEQQPALIVLAVELAGIDGLAAAKLLKSDPRTASIPVLHISNHGGHSRGYAQSIESGAEAYLESPVEPAVLLAVVTATIQAESRPWAAARLASRLDHDLDDVKRLAADLRERIEEVSTMMEVTPVAIWVAHDRECLHITGNRMASRLFEADVTENVSAGATTARRFSLHGRELRPEELPLHMAGARGVEIRNAELDVRLPSGKRISLLGSACPLRDAEGLVRGGVGAFLDVTESKQAQEALGESEAILRALFDSPDVMRGIVELAGGRIVHVSCNSTAAEMYGVNGESIAGKSPAEVGASDEIARAWVELYETSRRTGKPVSMKYTRRDADGKERFLLATASFLGMGHSGNPRCGYTILDLTEVARAEQALRAERKRLHLALDACNSGIWEWDVRTNEVFWSEEMWKINGLERGLEPSYQRWLDAILSDDRSMVEQAVNEAAQHGTEINIQFRISAVDGEEHWLMCRGQPQHDAAGQTVRYVGIALDITSQKRAEEAARHASEQRLLALEAARLGAWDYYFGTRELVWDERSGNMFGLPAGRIQATEVMARVHPGDRAAIRQALAEVIATAGGGAFHCEYLIGWPDGSEHWISSHGRVYFTGEGDRRRPARFVGVNLDITLQKQAEKRFREAQKLESLGLLAGGVAHDFNNLLVGVIGNASLAIEMLPPRHPSAELMEGVLRAGEQAAHLTRQMLAYSGKGKFQLEALDLSALVPEMSGLVRPSISRRIALEFDLDPQLPPIEADRGQVQQVFMNLALNAAEAIGGGDGLITVRTGVQEVDERFATAKAANELRPGRYVCLEVRDNGCGMDDATRARIFEPFFSTKFTGRGLGLAAVAGILRGHHGAILVSSTPGAGSCFTALFPALA